MNKTHYSYIVCCIKVYNSVVSTTMITAAEVLS